MTQQRSCLDCTQLAAFSCIPAGTTNADVCKYYERVVVKTRKTYTKRTPKKATNTEVAGC